MPLLLPKTASKNIWSFQNATVPQRGLLIFHWLDGEKIFLNQFCISSQAHSLPLPLLKGTENNCSLYG